ncbi:MAG TPA: thioredoxin domain-containing protein [Acidobacteriaceae bacterium]|nr:thioredoxin domain-containing protein [Acidobacteriaceae bacterium]
MTNLSIPVNANDHLQGDPDAPCILVEYGDYQCPSCGAAYPIVKRVQKHFGERLAFVFRNFPLTQLHRFAEAAAETAEFAGAHGKFWQMHDLLYENQDRLEEQLLVELAQQVHLASAALIRALESKEFQPRVKADFSSGVRSGVNGTPTFFINGQRLDGPNGFSALVAAIDNVLE